MKQRCYSLKEQSPTGPKFYSNEKHLKKLTKRSPSKKKKQKKNTHTN